jgi:RNA polymerase sigma factor (sigma-70 family)
MTVDTKFWDKVYRENAPKLIGVCRRYVKNQVVAEDLVQETFLVALKKINTYSGSGSLEGWLRKIAVNMSLMHIREGKLKIETNSLLLDIEGDIERNDVEDALDSNVGNHLESNFFLSAIDKLPTHHKTVFNLYVLDNYSHKEIAEELKISIGTSKSHLARARKKLQLEIKEKLREGRQFKKLGVVILFTTLSKITMAKAVDWLFKSRLKHFSIKPCKYANFSTLNVDPQTLIQPHRFRFFSFKRYVFQIKGFVATFAFLAVGAELTNVNSFKSPQFINQSIKEKSIYLDTLQRREGKPSQVSVQSNEQGFKPKSAIADSQNNPDVVIKKQIIKKQTVKVHNTIIVYDTAEVN